MNEEKITKQAEAERSPFNWTAVFFISLFLGFFGVDRFYIGKKISGVIKLLTLGGSGIWWLVDLFIIASGKSTDASKRKILNTSKQRILAFVLIPLAIVVVVGVFSSPEEREQIKAEQEQRTAEREQRKQTELEQKKAELKQEKLLLESAVNDFKKAFNEGIEKFITESKKQAGKQTGDAMNLAKIEKIDVKEDGTFIVQLDKKINGVSNTIKSSGIVGTHKKGHISSVTLTCDYVTFASCNDFLTAASVDISFYAMALIHSVNGNLEFGEAMKKYGQLMGKIIENPKDCSSKLVENEFVYTFSGRIDGNMRTVTLMIKSQKD